MCNTKLYGIEMPCYRQYFDSAYSRENYLSTYFTNLSFNITTLEFLGEVYGKTDVFAITRKNGITLYSILSETEFLYLDGREPAWKLEYGNLRTEYNALKENGVQFSQKFYNDELIREKAV